MNGQHRPCVICGFEVATRTPDPEHDASYWNAAAADVSIYCFDELTLVTHARAAPELGPGAQLPHPPDAVAGNVLPRIDPP